MREFNMPLFKSKTFPELAHYVLGIILLWMSNFLSSSQIASLRTLHKKTRDKRSCDKIKVILLLNSGYSYEHIGEVLLLDDETIRRWYFKYEDDGVDGLLSYYYTGGTSKLSDLQQQELIVHLDRTVYLTAKEICAYVLATYNVEYSVKGMTCLLHALGFSYKKPKHVPGKADVEAQLEFIEAYEKLKKRKKEADKIYFMDGVHPLHNSQPAYGWIQKGSDMILKSNTGRERLNLNGAYNIEDHTAIIQETEMINAQSTISVFTEIMRKQPMGKIYIILDNARYYRCGLVQSFVKRNKRIQLVFLPPYSPNLNIIERLWKFFKKNVTYNKYYEKYTIFRENCLSFFRNIETYRSQLETLMTDNFQIIQT